MLERLVVRRGEQSHGNAGEALVLVQGGVGDIFDVVDVVADGTVTYVATGTVSLAAVGDLFNTAVVDSPSGNSDPDPANNADTVITTVLIPSPPPGGADARAEVVP